MDGGVLVVGAGQGGFQLAASLRDEGFGGPIRLIGDEPGLPYQRPPLSKAFLKGDGDPTPLRLRPAAFYAQRAIELIEGQRVAAIDRAGHQVRLADGRTLGYGHLVLATGARNRRLSVPGAELDGVFSIRTLADAADLRERLAAARQVVVIGAGFLGLEFAAVAASLGAEVHVVEATERPMGRAVSPAISQFFAEHHQSAGIAFTLRTGVARILGNGGRAAGVETADGRRLGADLVLVAIGIAPNVELAAEAGLAVRNGIVVDRQLATSDPAISALGDCAAYPSRFAGGPGSLGEVRLESVQNAVDQGRCLAARLAGRPMPYDAVPWFWSDQGALKLQTVGITAGAGTTVVRGDPAAGSFSVFCFQDRRLIGIESVNRPADHMAGRKLLAGAPALTPEEAADPGLDLRAYAAQSSSSPVRAG